MCVVRVAVAWSDVSVFFLRDGGDCARSSSAAQHCLTTCAGDPGRRSGKRWLTRKTKAAAHTHSCCVSLRALLCRALRVARSPETLRCAWCVWQSRGLTCLFSFCATGEVVECGSALPARPQGNDPCAVQRRVLLLWDTCVCGSRAGALSTHGTTLWLRMRHRDDSSPPVSCTHLLTAWLVSAAKAVSSSRSWAGRTSPRESFVCEEALTSNADCIRTHSRMGADHTCSTSSLRAAHNALFGAARTNSVPEARTSGPFFRFKKNPLGLPPLLKCNVTSSVAHRRKLWLEARK